MKFEESLNKTTFYVRKCKTEKYMIL